MTRRDNRLSRKKASKHGSLRVVNRVTDEQLDSFVDTPADLKRELRF